MARILNDISEYYQQADHAAQEELAWARAKFYRRNGAMLRVALDRFTWCDANTRVLELACGTGWTPAELPSPVQYVGIDKTPEFIELARAKQAEVGRPNTVFRVGDLREVQEPGPFDVVAIFAALKHFGLHEWDAIVQRVLSFAPTAVLDIQCSDADRDNGTTFHHVYVTPEHAERAIQAAGHRVVEREQTESFRTPEGWAGSEWLYLTHRSSCDCCD